ncbi:DUF429 domain-containing protein [Clostridium estertheticum]|uniref:DUF429 domain-containing protein n=1 Tax=Clostridium estertheticum TaxID=238834 RepID=UPI001C7CCD19|nr:DUF429 domain-containing protein [Clostridium estertheticum]MBX4268453.1 DUF429 domain-containing protein [Clostridium estertheticum]WLC81487.1 DUF429 domain-containing protein [Clostridium estertheticum]
MNFIGVDVHKEKLTVASIDEKLNIEFIDNMIPDGLLNYLKNKEVSVIAVDAPYKLNYGFMNNDQYRMTLNCKLKGHYNKKVSEYELSRRGINPFSTPGSMDEITGWKGWIKTGFNLYTRIEELGYIEISDRKYNNTIQGFIEVFPHACFTVLLEYIPSPKDTDKGLKERFDILEKSGFKGLEKILFGSGRHGKTDKLDALVAAYTGYLTYIGNVTFIGNVDEGQIVLPTCALKESYKRLKKLTIPKATSFPVLQFERNKDGLVYDYINVDSVLWLKHFTPINSSPPICNLIVGNINNRIKVIITNDQSEGIEVELELLKNRKDGLKVCIEDKVKLADFWGRNGDNRKYIISIV